MKNLGVKLKPNSEKEQVEEELNGFVYEKSIAWATIVNLFSSGIRHFELLSIAGVVSEITDVPKLQRVQKRSFPCLVKWFNDNWENIFPVLSGVKLLDKNKIPINGYREMASFTV